MEHFPATHKINVPFTYETRTSGIGEEKFHPQIWYRRVLTLSPNAVGKRTILHFEGVDYKASCLVNGLLTEDRKPKVPPEKIRKINLGII